MKTLLMLATVLAFPSAQAVTPPPVTGGESRIVEVTVFQDRASVKRVKSIRLPAGATSVKFTGLTPLLNPDSLKVRMGEKRNLTLLGIRHEIDHRLASSNKEGETLRNKKRDLVAERERLLAQAEGLRQEKGNLNHLTNHYEKSFAYNLHQNSWSRPQFRELMSFLGKQANESNGRWQKLFLRYNEIDKEIRFVENKLSEIASDSETQSSTVIVDLVAEAPTTTELSLQYLVPEAGWAPVYDLRILPGKGNAVLYQNALVWQRSGEDWEKVSLMISNNNTELSPVVPVIERYTLSIHDAEKVTTTVTGSQQDTEALGTGEAGGDEGKENARTFRINGLQTVRHGMTSTKVAVGQTTTTYKENFELVASQFPHVFRKVELKNGFAWDLAPGSLNVYYQGAFLQQTDLPEIPKGKLFAVNSGIEHNIHVERWHEEKNSKSGVISQKRHYAREFKTSLENYGRETRKVRVLEQVPISELSEVTISTEGSTTGFKKDEDHPGWVAWDISLAPRKVEKLSLNLKITAPETFQFSW